MSQHSFVSPALLGWLVGAGLVTSTVLALAQVPPPPLPPAFDDEDTEVKPDASAEAEGDVDSEVRAEGGASADESSPAAQESTPAAESEREPWELPVEETAEPSAESAATWFRKVSTRRQMTLTGSTGLLRVVEAGSGAPGTFRIGVTGSYFGKKAFLCRDNAPCTDSAGNDLGEDKARHSDTIIAISVTPFSFLEAFLSIHNSATSNSNGAPRLLQVVGDTYLGLKGFMPDVPDRVFSFGGQADLRMLSGTGGLGLAGGATGFSFTGLASLNLNNRTRAEDRIPLRAHANIGYLFDNSGNIVRDLENTSAPRGRGEAIERTERYGLGISRVDSFQIGLGTEYVHDYVRPYLEWTIDVPVNRQKYVCNIQGAEGRGDECLGVAAGFATSPSRLTLGTRIFPWQATGLALTGAVDIGTGGKRRFLEETTPETPYTIWFGLGYTVDTVPPAAEKVQVTAPVAGLEPETRRYILGQVSAEGSGAAVPDAIIRYDGVPMTGLVADASGQFISQDLPPGEYTFKIFAEQFREGTCSVTIPQDAAPSAQQLMLDERDASAQAEAPEENGGALTIAPPQEPYLDQDGNLLVPIQCELKELPRVADVTGLLVDSQSSGPVPDGSIKITDKLNRSLNLEVDDQGSFQFRNVPFGTAHLTASAPGYLTTVMPINIESRDGLKPHVVMNRRPDKLDVTVGPREISLGKPIRFVGETADVAMDSMFILEQLAEVIKGNDGLENIEVQVHTDDSGSPTYARRLSQERADRIVDILVQLGAVKRKLSGKGYGPDQPLVPNVSDGNRAKNNRVQIILKQ